MPRQYHAKMSYHIILAGFVTCTEALFHCIAIEYDLSFICAITTHYSITAFHYIHYCTNRKPILCFFSMLLLKGSLNEHLLNTSYYVNLDELFFQYK